MKLRDLLAAALAAVVVISTAALSRVPVAVADADAAVLRLSWRLQGLAVEECRTLSAEELAALPAHMRRSEECVRRFVDYGLHVAVNGADVLRDTVGPSGARRDRPVYVLRDVALPPGSHDVRVAFDAQVPDGFDPGDRPARFLWEGRVALAPGEIAVVTLDPAEAALTRVEPGG